MAVIQRDHLSGEVGHSAGISRIVLALGLVLVGLGVVAFVSGLALGLADARSGSAGGDRTMTLFGLGGGAVVIGTLVAAVGMAWARRDAGE